MYISLINLVQSLLYCYTHCNRKRTREEEGIRSATEKIMPENNPLLWMPTRRSSAGQITPSRKKGNTAVRLLCFHCLRWAKLKPHYTERYRRHWAKELWEPCTCSRCLSRQGGGEVTEQLSTRPISAAPRRARELRRSRDRHGSPIPARHWESRQEPRPSPAPPGCPKAAQRDRLRAMGVLGEEELPAVPNNVRQRNLGDPQ